MVVVLVDCEPTCPPRVCNDGASSNGSSNQSLHVYCLKNILYVGSSVFSFHGYPSSDKNWSRLASCCAKSVS
jgi:hypothetical protein